MTGSLDFAEVLLGLHRVRFDGGRVGRPVGRANCVNEPDFKISKASFDCGFLKVHNLSK